MPIGNFRFNNSSDKPATPTIHYWRAGHGGELWTNGGGHPPPQIQPKGVHDLGLTGQQVCKIGPVSVELQLQQGGVQTLVLGGALDYNHWNPTAPGSFQEIDLDVTGTNGAYQLTLTVRGAGVGRGGEAVLAT